MSSRLSLRSAVIVLLWGLFVSFCQMISPGELTIWSSTSLSHHLRYALGLYCISWLGYFMISLYLVKFTFRAVSKKALGHQSQIKRVISDQQTRRLLYLLLIVTRVSWWGSPPSSSEDVWRYLWDGERVSQGELVYIHPPHKLSGQSLSSEDIRLRIGHAHISTVYPPGAQHAFALSYQLSLLFGESISSRLISWRCITLLAELALLAALLSICKMTYLPPASLILYVLCPFVPFESALSAHLDIVGISAMMIGIMMFMKNQIFLSGALIGLAIMIKFIPLITLGLMLMSYLKRGLRVHLRALVLLIGGCLTSTLLLTAPFLTELISFNGLWPGLKTYREHWYFNGSIYPCIRYTLELLDPSLSQSEIRQITTLLLGSILFFTVILISWKLPQKKDKPKVDEILIPYFIGCFLLLFFSPVVFSWYLLWLYPVAHLYIFRTKIDGYLKIISIMTLVWCMTIGLTYLPRLELLENGLWNFGLLYTMIEYGTVSLTLVVIKRYSDLRLSLAHS